MTMPQRKQPVVTSDSPAVLTPVVLHPRLVLSLEQARQALGLAKNCLPREVRKRRLRVAKRAGRYFTTGKWLMGWLTTGEVCHPPGNNGAAAA
jgi:hypothetical protein